MSVRVLLLSAVALLTAGAVNAADDNPEPPVGGLKQLQGEWPMQSLGSTKPAAELAKQFQVSIKGDRWTLTSGKKGKLTTWHIKVDTSKKPMTIDVFVKDGDKQTIVWRGIYKLEGDLLTVCRTTGDSGRPTSFEPKGSKGMLIVWNRAKK
jgi:uncharacterized protein (TIGR03067 family)